MKPRDWMHFLEDVVFPSLRQGPLPVGKRVSWIGGVPVTLPELSEDEWKDLLGESAWRQVAGPVGDRGISIRTLRRYMNIYRDMGMRSAALGGAGLKDLDKVKTCPPAPGDIRVAPLVARAVVNRELEEYLHPECSLYDHRTSPEYALLRSPFISDETLRFIRSDPQYSVSFGHMTTPSLGDPAWSETIHHHLIQPVLEAAGGGRDLVAFSLQVLRFSKESIGFHFDPSAYHCIAGYNLQGSVVMRLQGGGGIPEESAEVPEGHFYVIPPKVVAQRRHAVQCVEGVLRIAGVIRFVPRADLQKIREAIVQQGAGRTRRIISRRS